MSTATTTLGLTASVVIIGPELLAGATNGATGSLRVERFDDVLAAMERLAAGGVHAVLAWTASLPSRSEAALGAVRELLPAEAKVLLIARPDEEPLARDLADSVGGDYLIWPLQKAELIKALGLRGESRTKPAATQPQAEIAISRLAEALALAETDMGACLDKVAAMVTQQLQARGCTIELPQMMSVCGEAIGEPVLTADIDLGAAGKGRLAVGPRRGEAYGAADADTLQVYATMLSAVCRLALTAARWQREAQTDELTGLLNRRGLMLRLPELLERARRQRTPVTVLMFDMDNFKHYNDAYGHHAGDEILRETGQLFVRHTRKHDLVARYGGDEFVVVFWEENEPRVAGSKPPRDPLVVLGRFRQSLERHEFRSLGPEAQGALTISGGLITFPWDAASTEELIGRADEALLLAKRQGKNRIWLVGQGAQ